MVNTVFKKCFDDTCIPPFNRTGFFSFLKKKSFIKINHVSISQSISEYVQFIGACSAVVVAVDLTFLLYDCISSSLLCTWCRLIKA